MKRMIGLLIAVSMLLTLVACAPAATTTAATTQGGSTTGSAAATTTAAAKKDPIKIGLIAPLTGDAAPWGQAQLNTLKMLIEDTNKAGGVIGSELELYHYDNRSDNVESANAARKLIEQDGVSAIIGTNASGTTIAIASVCDEKKIPQIATNATNVKVTVNNNAVRPYTFRVCFTDPQLGSLIAQYAYNSMGIKTASTMFEIGSDYSTGVKDAFEASFKKAGGTIINSEAFKTGEVDFRAQLSKIKEGNPEAVFFPAVYKQIGLAANQARDLGITAKFLGTDTWNTKDMLELAGEAVEGSAFTNMIDMFDPQLDPLKAKYKAKYNEAIDVMGTTGYFAYDSYQLLIQAIEKAGKNDPVAIRDQLEKATDVPGCVGKFSIDPATHNPSRNAAVMTIEGGKFKTLSTVKPE